MDLHSWDFIILAKSFFYQAHLTDKYPNWSNIPSVIPNYLPPTLKAINIMEIKRLVVVGGGKVATNFNVSLRQEFKFKGLSGAFRGLLMTIPCLSLPDPCHKM